MEPRADKRDRAPIFRERLITAMRTAGMSQSALARAAGADRSTLSALLSEDAVRLPNAQLAANCAEVLGVSLDWLMGLTERPERAGALLDAAMDVTETQRTPTDETLLAWQKEAAGYKVRHVPATLPDVLKTPAMLRWEYAAFLGKTPDQAIAAMEDRVVLLTETDGDMEIAMPLDALEALASGHGYYADAPRETRIAQFDRMIEVTERMYPSLRMALYDARRLFSAPVSIFGPLIGVVYVGRFYLVFRETRRIRALTQHFDSLVREAEVEGRAIPAHLRQLRDRA